MGWLEEEEQVHISNNTWCDLHSPPSKLHCKILFQAHPARWPGVTYGGRLLCLSSLTQRRCIWNSLQCLQWNLTYYPTDCPNHFAVTISYAHCLIFHISKLGSVPFSLDKWGSTVQTVNQSACRIFYPQGTFNVHSYEHGTLCWRIYKCTMVLVFQSLLANLFIACCLCCFVWLHVCWY